MILNQVYLHSNNVMLALKQ
ncbi:hypothetical protein MXB_3723 [Myxobolus squamalis]|nr:hypothetical protein MXB_3723 [Myxobolus squamalis]